MTSYKQGLFNGAIAVITGGTSGIGQATAFYFAELGAKVYALGLGADKFGDTKGLDISVKELDVTDEAAVRSFFSELDQLDILFNGAGANFNNQYDYHVFKRNIELNQNSVFLMSTLAHDLLKKSSIASIVNVSSMYAIFGSDLAPAYSASKGAVDQLTKSLAIQYAKDNIRVNAVAPGWISTPLLAPFADTEMGRDILKRTPFKKFGDPREIARGAVFLSTEEASFITGAILPIDGGYSIA